MGALGCFWMCQRAPRLIRPNSEDLVSDPQTTRAGLERWVLVCFLHLADSRPLWPLPVRMGVAAGRKRCAGGFGVRGDAWKVRVKRNCVVPGWFLVEIRYGMAQVI